MMEKDACTRGGEGGGKNGGSNKEGEGYKGKIAGNT